MDCRYVFIVGLPRTGSKLVKNILECSRATYCRISPETSFLGNLLRPGLRHHIRRLGSLSVDANVDRLIDYIYSDMCRGTYWRMLRSGQLGVDRAALLRELLSCDRTEKGIYEVILRIHAVAMEDAIFGDKTPSHLYHVPQLMDWFPDARIVHTFRDPRALLASEWLKRMSQPATPFAPGVARPLHSLVIVLHVTVTWLYAIRLHHRYTRLYPLHYDLFRFEDLVSDPETHVRRLCEFADVEFDHAMLAPPQVDSSYPRESGWGFDQETLTRWRDYLKPWMATWLLFWGKKHMEEFGYLDERPAHDRDTVSVLPERRRS